jgi:hypothetical protein
MHDHFGRDVFQSLANVSVDDRHLFAAAGTPALFLGNIDRVYFARQVLGKTVCLTSLATTVADLFFDNFRVVFDRCCRLWMFVEQRKL